MIVSSFWNMSKPWLTSRGVSIAIRNKKVLNGTISRTERLNLFKTCNVEDNLDITLSSQLLRIG